MRSKQDTCKHKANYSIMIVFAYFALGITDINFNSLSMLRKGRVETFEIRGLVALLIHKPDWIVVQFDIEHTIKAKSK